jgi:hypothetical protein
MAVEYSWWLGARAVTRQFDAFISVHVVFNPIYNTIMVPFTWSPPNMKLGLDDLESSGVIGLVSKSGTHKGGLEVREVWHDWRAFVMPAAFFLADLEG